MKNWILNSSFFILFHTFFNNLLIFPYKPFFPLNSANKTLKKCCAPRKHIQQFQLLGNTKKTGIIDVLNKIFKNLVCFGF